MNVFSCENMESWNRLSFPKYIKKFKMYAIFRNFIQVVYDAVWDQTLLYIYDLAQQSSLKIKNGNLSVLAN